jgi:hypothetical protein
LQHDNQHPDEARLQTILQLEILSGVAKGLTHIVEGYSFEGELEPAELDKINLARQDMRMVKVREGVFGVVRNVVEIWSADVGVGHVRIFFFSFAMSFPIPIYPSLLLCLLAFH